MSSTSRRVAPLPKDWAITRLRILARDGYRCTQPRRGSGTRCSAAATEVDHRIPASAGGGEGDDNLQSMCRRHHLSKTGREAQAIGARRRPDEPHPGTLDAPSL